MSYHHRHKSSLTQQLCWPGNESVSEWVQCVSKADSWMDWLDNWAARRAGFGTPVKLELRWKPASANEGVTLFSYCPCNPVQTDRCQWLYCSSVSLVLLAYFTLSDMLFKWFLDWIGLGVKLNPVLQKNKNKMWLIHDWFLKTKKSGRAHILFHSTPSFEVEQDQPGNCWTVFCADCIVLPHYT